VNHKSRREWFARQMNEFLKFFNLEFDLEEMEILKNEQVILTDENIIDGEPENEVKELNYNIINKENGGPADVGIDTVKPTKFVRILAYYFKVHDDGTLVYVYKGFNLQHIKAIPFYDTIKYYETHILPKYRYQLQMLPTIRKESAVFR
jgi:hypothetical protein